MQASLRAQLRLIVGLGNPGADYSKTRHNAGFWFCERLSKELGVSFTQENRYHGWVANVRSDSRSDGRSDCIWLLMPSTFMNDSGRSAQALMNFYRITPDEILVIHDELDLPPGRLQLRFGGGLGGHNGLKSLAAHFNTQDFWRLRVGIGHPGDRNEVVHYVLKPPRKEEQEDMDTALDRALLTWPLLAKADFDAAMRKINVKPAPPPSPPSPARGEGLFQENSHGHEVHPCHMKSVKCD
ncbi:MAG: aminoacyl-tRNA hydrolase [Rhodocyclaceae bacterium]|nr:aminoacyl-tRNA hydrolase [Rhodocyclaceae bacterium]